MSIVGAVFGLALLAGCAKSDVGPRFAGRVVSHVDTYGSGTSTQSVLGREGSLRGGFDYGDSSKVDWTAEVTWRFLRRDDTNDVYTVEWTFRPKGGASDMKAKEVSFDGTQAVRVFENQWQVISIEPGSIATNSAVTSRLDLRTPPLQPTAALRQGFWIAFQEKVWLLIIQRHCR